MTATDFKPPALPLRRSADGLELPAIGLGTYAMHGSAGTEAIISALHQGYRLIDSAFNYENEGAVGRAIRESGVPREEVIVTSKLPGRHHAFDEAIYTIEESISRMGLDYIDLYLIHWPNPSQGQFVEAWRALIEARNRGLVRHIGVSNFMPGHLEQLIRLTGVTPAVNQIELHPYFQQKELRAYHEAHGIITEAWSPLGRSRQAADPDLVRISEKHGITVHQAVLRWHVQLGDVCIPKSANPGRQRANLDLTGFELDKQDMADISALDNPNGRGKEQDPRWHEEP